MAMKVNMYSWSNYILLFKLFFAIVTCTSKREYFKNGYIIERIVKESYFKTESKDHSVFYPVLYQGPFSQRKTPEPNEVISPPPLY
jgi:hypothetical protein